MTGVSAQTERIKLKKRREIWTRPILMDWRFKGGLRTAGGEMVGQGWVQARLDRNHYVGAFA